MDGLRFDGWQKNGMEISNEVIFLNEKKKRKRKIDELDTAGYDVEGGQVCMYGKAREGTQSSSINQRGTDQSHHDDLPGGYEEAIQTKV